MTFRAFLCVVVVVGMTSLGPMLARGQEPSRQGLVNQRPTTGPFVKTDLGYMVPYEQRIPGTDIKFEMVPIPGGRFLLGSPNSEPGRQDAEGPQVSVMMEPFWMGKHEVTWKEFRIYMGLEEAFKKFERHKIRIITEEREVDAITAPSLVYDLDIPYGGGQGPDTPAVTMTHYAAKQYTKWLSLLLEDFYRLPSEAEWEYACRAGTTTAYSFGDDASKLADYAWFEANSDEQRHEVGSKRPNPWGLYDMHGNVAEWVLDAFTADGYSAIGDDAVKSEAAIRWPNDFYPRVARGGSWELGAGDLRSAARLASGKHWSDQDPDLPNSPWWHSSFPATGVGFRILRPLSVPETALERERFWEAENDDIQATVQGVIENSGRGARGLVDPDLPKAIRLLFDEGR